MQATVGNEHEARQAVLLEEEIEYYEQHFDEYREKHPGRHLLIAGKKLHGHYATREEAVVAGYEGAFEAMLIRESGTRPPVSFLPTIVNAWSAANLPPSLAPWSPCPFTTT